MSLFFTLNSVGIAVDRVRLTGSDNTDYFAFTSSAIAGGADTAHVRIEDPDGTMTPPIMQPFWVDEYDCNPSRIWTGTVISATVVRAAYHTGAARAFDCELIGVNAGAGLRVLSDRDHAKRPAETNLARITWLLGTTAVIGASTLFADDGFISGTAVDMPEQDCRGMTPAEVLNSMGGEIGRNWFLFWNPSLNHTTLFYSSVDSGVGDSTLSVSNVLADVNNTTVFEPGDPRLTSSGEEIYAGVYVQFRGSGTFVQNNATATAYVDRHLVVRNDRIGRLATAQAFGTRLLDEHDAPRDLITFALPLPDTKVNLLREGQRVQVKFSHLPAYTSYTTVVIRRRTVMQSRGNPDMYWVSYEASASPVAGNPGGGDPGSFPAQPCQAALVQSKTKTATTHGAPLVLDQTPTVGNLLTAWTVVRGTTPDALNPVGFTGLGADWISDPSTGPKALRCRIWYRLVQVGDDATIDNTLIGSPGDVYYVVSEWSGVDRLDFYSAVLDDTDQSGDPMIFGAGPLTPIAGRPALEVAGIMPSLNVNDAWNPAETTGATLLGASGVGPASGGISDPKSWFGYKAGPAALGTPIIFTVSATPVSGISRGWAGPMAVFSGDCSTTPEPLPGAPVDDGPAPATGGGATSGTTASPYADGSLMVFVDGILQPVQETDPTTGAYRLYFDPRASEVVTVRYQGR